METSSPQQQQDDTTNNQSATSGSGTSSSKNLQAKYQKLAAEYAKVRSQVQVLKKAVVDEQQCSESLKSTLTAQDQSIRKLEQELDSVKFRNRQLEKRIEILQEDSAAAAAAAASSTTNQKVRGTGSSTSSTSSSGSASSKHPTPGSFDSNLLLHVEQNKQLQESLATLNERYTTEVGRLKRMIDHEMVPRDLLDSIKSEHAERVGFLNKRLSELAIVNAEFRDRVDGYELERRQQQQQQGSQAGVADNEGFGSTSGNNSIELVRKLTESEQARERLNADVQILRLKLKRYASVEEDGGGGRGSTTYYNKSQPESTVTSPVVVEERSNMIGRLQVIGIPGPGSGAQLTAQDSSSSSSADDKDVLVFYLRDRVNELVKSLQLSDSKAVHYYHEALTLCRLVRTSQLSYKRLDGEFAKLKAKYRGLHDELEDTKRIHSLQVDSLTEHIAILNEKLAGHVEEIVALKSSSKA